MNESFLHEPEPLALLRTYYKQTLWFQGWFDAKGGQEHNGFSCFSFRHKDGFCLFKLGKKTLNLKVLGMVQQLFFSIKFVHEVIYIGAHYKIKLTKNTSSNKIWTVDSTISLKQMLVKVQVKFLPSLTFLPLIFCLSETLKFAQLSTV